MIFGWTDALLKEAFSSLTSQESLAIDLTSAMKNPDGLPSSRTCKRYGFKSLADFVSNRDTGRLKLVTFFNSKGIHSVEDLTFPAVGHTNEYTLMTKATMIRKAG